MTRIKKNGNNKNNKIKISNGKVYLYHGLKGNDIVTVTKGNGHFIYGDEGSDQITGTTNRSVIYGGSKENDKADKAYTNTLKVSGYGNKIYGAYGADYIYVSSGTTSKYKKNRNEVYGGNGNDVLEVKKGYYNRLYGQKGNDIIYVKGSGRYNYLYGGEGSDTITVVGNKNNLFSGDNENDKTSTKATDKLIVTGSGNKLHGKAYGTDKFYIYSPSSKTNGSSNESYGYSGINYFTIGEYSGKSKIMASDNKAVGGNGKDYFYIYGNRNLIYGGNGNNTYVLYGGVGNQVTGGTGADKVTITGDGNEIDAKGGADVIDLTGNDNSIETPTNTWTGAKATYKIKGDYNYIGAYGGPSSNSINNYNTISDNNNNSSVTKSDSFTYNLFGKNNRIYASYTSRQNTFKIGNDKNSAIKNLIVGSNSSDGVDDFIIYGDSNFCYAESGSDTISVVNGNRNAIYGGAGTDVIKVLNGNENYLMAGVADRIIEGNYFYNPSGQGYVLDNYNRTLYHNEESDGQFANLLIVENGSNNFLFGAAGDDYISAKGENNNLYGYGGDDTLEIKGSGLLVGGKGADSFYIYENGNNSLYGNDHSRDDDKAVDTFYFNSGTTGTNTIGDYKSGDNGDIINLSNDPNLYVFVQSHAFDGHDLTLNLSNTGTIILEGYTLGTKITFYGSQDGSAKFSNFKRSFS